MRSLAEQGRGQSGLFARSSIALSASILTIPLWLREPSQMVAASSQIADDWLSLVSAASLLFLVGAFGWRLLGLRLSSPVGLAVGASIVGGYMATALVILVLALAGRVSRVSTSLLLIGLCICGTKSVESWVGALRRVVREFVGLWPGFWGRVTLFGQTGLAFLFVISAMAPTTDWDSLMYHLRVPIDVADAGALEVPPDNSHVSFAGANHMVSVIFVQGGLDRASQVYSALGVVSLLILVGSSMVIFCGRSVARYCVVVLLSLSGLILAGRTAQVEVWLVVTLMVAVGLAVLFWRNPHDRVTSIALGISLGALVGIKLSGLIHSGVIAFGLLLLGSIRKRICWRVVRLGVVAFIVSAIPWLVKNELLLNDPLYPFLFGRGPERWLIELGASTEPLRYRILEAVREPFDPISWIFDPAHLTVEGTGFYQGLSLLLVMGVLAAILMRGSARGIVLIAFVGTCAAAGAIILASPPTNLRYLLPIQAILAVIAGYGLSTMAHVGRMWRSSTIVLIGLNLIPSAAVFWSVVVTEGSVARELGVMSHAEWLDNNPDASALVRIDNTLQELETVRPILLFEGRASAFREDVLADNAVAAWQYLVELSRFSCPDVAPSSHLVVNRDAVRYLVERGMDPRRARWSEFPSFVERCLEPVTRQDGYDIYSIAQQAESNRG